MADSSSGDVNQATPDDPPPTAQQPIQSATPSDHPGTINPSFNPDTDPSSYPFLFSPEGATEAPGASDIESLARRRFAPAAAARGAPSWQQGTAAGAQDSTSAAIASLLYHGQGSDPPASPQHHHGGSPDPSLAAIQAAVTGLDSGEALGYNAPRPAQMAAQAGSAPDADADIDAATSSGGAGSGHNPRQRGQHRSSAKSGGRSSRRGRGRDDDGSDVDAATERRRRRRCAGFPLTNDFPIAPVQHK